MTTRAGPTSKKIESIPDYRLTIQDTLTLFLRTICAQLGSASLPARAYSDNIRSWETAMARFKEGDKIKHCGFPGMAFRVRQIYMKEGEPAYNLDKP